MSSAESAKLYETLTESRSASADVKSSARSRDLWNEQYVLHDKGVNKNSTAFSLVSIDSGRQQQDRL